MSKVKTESLVIKQYSKVDDYVMLIKLRLSLLVVFTSIIGMVTASGGDFAWSSIFLLGIAGLLVTAAANALNQVLEKDYDILMERTKNRPIAAGRMTSSEAVMFAGISCLIGITLLALFNPLTALLGMLSMVTYAFVYTPLKRYSTLAVAIGAIPGALPVLIGFTAFTGEITTLALVLFVIQFLWQFPHFWSIGFLAFEDYQKAGYKLLPESNGRIDRNVGLYAGVYAVLAIPVIGMAYVFTETGLMPTVVGIISSIVFTYLSINLFRKHDKKSALLLMFSSFFYLPVVLLAYMVSF